MLSYAVHALDHDGTKVILKPVVVDKLYSLVWAFYVTHLHLFGVRSEEKIKKERKERRRS